MIVLKQHLLIVYFNCSFFFNASRFAALSCLTFMKPQKLCNIGLYGNLSTWGARRARSQDGILILRNTSIRSTHCAVLPSVLCPVKLGPRRHLAYEGPGKIAL